MEAPFAVTYAKEWLVTLITSPTDTELVLAHGCRPFTRISRKVDDILSFGGLK